jgi:hypothetical protein
VLVINALKRLVSRVSIVGLRCCSFMALRLVAEGLHQNRYPRFLVKGRKVQNYGGRFFDSI